MRAYRVVTEHIGKLKRRIGRILSPLRSLQSVDPIGKHRMTNARH